MMATTSDNEYPSGSTAGPAEQISQVTHNVRETLQREGRGIIQDAKEEVHRLAADRKQEAASLLRDVAEALSTITGKLNEQGHGRVAEYAGVAADRLRQVSDDLPARSLGQVLRQIDQFAHERPAIFVGALFVAGFTAARFLKASAEARTQEDLDEEIGSGERYRAAPGSDYHVV